MGDASGSYDGERPKEAAAPRSLWSRFKNVFSRSHNERPTEGGEPVPMAWLWSEFKAELPQSDDERRANEGEFTPLAWLWSQFTAKLPQSEEERRVLDEGPVPLAWLWSQFKAEHPQSESERRAAQGNQEVEQVEWRAQNEAFEAKLNGPPSSSPHPDEVSRSSVRLSSGREAVQPPGRPNTIPTNITRSGSYRISWLLAAVAIIATAGAAWRAAVPHSGNKAVLSPEEETRPSRSGEANLAPPEGTAPAQARKIPPAPRKETAQRGASETSIKPPEDAPATPAQTVGDNYTRIELANGIELTVPSSGVETKLLGFLKLASTKSGEFDLDGISFGPTNATLNPSSSEQLQNIAKILNAYPNTRIAINAYPDSTANTAPGVRLLRERANSVLRELARIGVDKSRMAARAYADNRAARSGGSEGGQRQDQRISLTVTRR
jgi:outer membrane protein OmpA-like peptidoglycan-associated protein